jgi:hypothetical protein
MTPSAKTIVSRQLRPGEQLLWSGRPPGGIRLRPSDALMIPFSLLWGGFAIFWEVMAIQGLGHAGGPGLFFALWGVPFVLVGLYIIAGRFYVDALLRRGTYYGVTNERAIILTTGPFTHQTRSLDLSTMAELEMSERGDGGGTISFGRAQPWSSFSPAGWPGAGVYTVPSFELDKRAREVYEIIRTAQREAQRGS